MRKRIWFLVLLILATAGYTRFLSDVHAVPLRKPLASIPSQIGEWQSRSMDLQENIVRVAGVEDYLLRDYWNVEGFTVSVYLGYYEQQREGDRYDPAALETLNRFFRCHYRDEVAAMDPKALDLLCDVWRATGGDRRVRVISGYRSPAYNEYLRRHGRGGAKNSQHLEDKAIDFLIPGVSNRKLASLARSRAAGGVGSYPTFVHIDTGPVRSWDG